MKHRCHQPAGGRSSACGGQIGRVADAAGANDAEIWAPTVEILDQIQIRPVAAADPIEAHRDHGGRPHTGIRPAAGAVGQRHSPTVERQDRRRPGQRVTCFGRTGQRLARKNRCYAPCRVTDGFAYTAPGGEAAESGIQPDRQRRIGRQQLGDDVRLRRTAGQRIEVGDVEQPATTMSEHRHGHHHRIATAAEAGAHRPVARAIAADRAYRASGHQIDHGNQLHDDCSQRTRP